VRVSVFAPRSDGRYFLYETPMPARTSL
jgi:hypothetical protein